MKKFTSLLVAIAALSLASSCCLVNKKCDRGHKKNKEASEKSEVKSDDAKVEVKAEAAPAKAEKKAKKAKKAKAEKKVEADAATTK